MSAIESVVISSSANAETKASRRTESDASAKLWLDAAKDLERHRCAYELAESIRERLHLVPLSLARTTCCLSDEEEQERCNRQCHKKEQRREWVCKRRDNEDQRDQHCARNHRW